MIREASFSPILAPQIVKVSKPDSNSQPQERLAVLVVVRGDVIEGAGEFDVERAGIAQVSHKISYCKM